MQTRINWNGRGWYAECQEDVHDTQCIVAYKLTLHGSTHEDENYDEVISVAARHQGLGTPFYLHSEEEYYMPKSEEHDDGLPVMDIESSGIDW